MFRLLAFIGTNLILFILPSTVGTVTAADSADPPAATPAALALDMRGAREEIYRRIDGVDLRAWVFEPDKPVNKPRPAVVFYFGGGWRRGTPRQFLPHSQYLARRGMVAVCADYRVSERHGTSPQDAVQDAKAAIRWVRSSAERLAVDPQRIVAAGGSAGGHLAAATALVPGFDPDPNSPVSSAPNALVLFNPAVILAPPEEPGLLSEEKLRDISERCQGRPKEISPYHHVRPGLPPSIIFHGTNDTAVPHATVVAFRDRMKSAGNRCELVSFPGESHGFFNFGRRSPQSRENESYHRTTALMDTFLVSLGYLSPSTPE